MNAELNKLKQERVELHQEWKDSIRQGLDREVIEYRAKKHDLVDKRIHTILNMGATTNPTQGFTCGA